MMIGRGAEHSAITRSRKGRGQGAVKHGVKAMAGQIPRRHRGWIPWIDHRALGRSNLDRAEGSLIGWVPLD